MPGSHIHGLQFRMVTDENGTDGAGKNGYP